MRIGYNVAERFVQERVAGRGGMGEVYRALDQRTGQPVAVNVLRSQKDCQVRRFERDALLLAELDHPLIARSREIVEG